MKQDIDRLMKARGFDAIVVTGPVAENMPLQYIVNGAGITGGTVVKQRDAEMLLLHTAMEREEAAKSGLTTADFSEFGYLEVWKETHDPFQAFLAMMQNVLESLKLKKGSTVAFYGLGDVGHSYMMMQALADMMPDLTLLGEQGATIFQQAFATKDDAELERIKAVAAKTMEVMGATVDFLRKHAVQEGHLVRTDGQSLTIGAVKDFIAISLAERRLEASEGVIFAQGRDGGIPHSRGEDEAAVELGKPIVFDLFPREAGGGYFHDITRTFCLGFVPADVQEVYDDVLACFNLVQSSMEVGQAAGSYQAMTCDFFESRGHPTIKSTPGTEEGYVHSLGHGVGLEIHGLPRLMETSSEDMFEVGNVFTIEPGLYYPERGLGVRIEDMVYFDAKGKLQTLSNYPKDLLIPFS